MVSCTVTWQQSIQSALALRCHHSTDLLYLKDNTDTATSFTQIWASSEKFSGPMNLPGDTHIPVLSFIHTYIYIYVANSLSPFIGIFM